MGDSTMKILQIHTEAEDTDARRFNNEWVEVELTRDLNPTDFRLEHLVQPGDESQGWQVYYIFRETQTFAQGTVFRIHAGRRSDQHEVVPGHHYRFRTEPHERGAFRLNRAGDLLRIVRPDGMEPDRAHVPAPATASAFHQEHVYAELPR
jgi:hypothetical protein